MASNTCLNQYRSSQNNINSFLVPCGKCSACINRKKKDWITRCYFESKSHLASIFVTLTYDDAHIPLVRDNLKRNNYLTTLEPDDVTKFLKRLRNHFFKQSRKIRYFYSGEYGSKGSKRPHYHMIIFGASIDDFLVFKDKKLLTNNLNDIWQLGHTDIVELKPAHAKYVVGYVSKKLGDFSDFLSPLQTKEFVRMSTRPPLGAGGLIQFAQNLLDNNSPFKDYYPTKHMNTLERYTLNILKPNYKTFPNILFHKRADTDKGSKGSFILKDLNSMSPNSAEATIKKFQELKMSFFRFDRTSSKILCNTLHHGLNKDIDNYILNYVKTQTSYFKDKQSTLKNALEWFALGYDKTYNDYVNAQSDKYTSDYSDYASSEDIHKSIKQFDKQERIALSLDTH